MAQPYGPEDFQRDCAVSRETLDRFRTYAELLRRWQKAINLVGPKTLPDLWRRHFLDSAQLMDYLPPAPAGRRLKVADLGSGAGFPGMVLALLGAGEVHLIESDLKKATFLREVSRETETAVTVHARRIEEVERLQADLVTARALAPLPQLVEYARLQVSSPGFCLFLKGKGVEEELTALGPAETIELELLPSRSDPSGRIVKIGGLRP